MKKTIILTLFAFLFTIFSCNKDSYNFNGDYSIKLTGKDYARFGLEGIKYNSLLDSIGVWHNEFQESSLKLLLASQVNLLDTIKVRKILLKNSIDFFGSKGFNVHEYHLDNLNLAKPFKSLFKSSDALSNEAKVILNELQVIISGFQKYDLDMSKKLQLLRSRALNLSNETEVLSVGIPIAIAEYSYKYWETKGDYWIRNLLVSENIKENDLTITNNSLNSTNAKSCKINLYKLGGADVSGAVSGAIAGSSVGPGGALAGAVLNSSVASAGIMINQVIDCHVSWWPF